MFQSRFAENLFSYGTSFGSSRQSNIRLQIFEAAETALAERSGAPSCLSLSSGFLAAQFLTQQLLQDGHRVFLAPNTHVASHPNGEIPFPDLDTFLESIESHFASEDPRTPAIVFDTVSFDNQPYPAPSWLSSLPLESIVLVADDSHGIGVMGEHGTGAYPLLQKLKAKEVFTCSSLAKACGLPGGAVFGAKETLDSWRERPAFAGASPMSPAALATYLQSEDLYKVQFAKLQRNVAHFQKTVGGSKILIQIPGHPAISHHDEALAHTFENNQIVTTRFRYPSANSHYINRIVLTASHLPEDIDRIAKIIRNQS